MLTADSIHATITNPASLGELKLTTFSVGVHYKNTQLSSTEAKENVTSSSLDYIAVSIPTKRFGFSFGIMPYSSVGYRLQSLEGIDDEIAPDVLSRYEGNGGLNRTFFSVGIPVFKGLNLGASFIYNFGTINTQASRQEENIGFWNISGQPFCFIRVTQPIFSTPKTTPKQKHYIRCFWKF